MSNVDVDVDEDSRGILPYLSIIAPLLLVYISNQWSRSSIYYLVNFSDSETVTPYSAMNVALHFSEAQYGALASVAFTALFAVASLVAGNLADRSDRKALTAAACLAWTAATVCTALSTDYSQVLAARVAMGLACAFATPCAYTLIRDLIPKERAALASSVYGSGVYFGGALASLSILLDERYGWSGTLGVISVFGLISAVSSVLFLPEDPTYNATDDNEKDTEPTASLNSSSSTEETPSFLSNSLSILSTPRVQYLFLASFVRFSAGLSIGVWGAPFFRQTYPDSSSSYAVINACIVGLCGVTSGILGGALADLAANKIPSNNNDNGNTGRLLVPVLGSLLAIPAWYMCIHASTFEYAMVWLAVEYLVAECWFGPVVAVLQSSVGPTRGGIAQGLFTLTGAVGNLTPSLLGILYSNMKFASGENTELGTDFILQDLLTYIVCGGYLLSAIFFALSATSGNTLVEGETQDE